MNDKKNRLRFCYEDDLVLLREFLNINPIVDPEGWSKIQEHINLTTKKFFQIRTLKNHLMLLIEIFLKKIKDEEVRSGVEEPFSEKDRLLEEVSSLCKDSDYSFKLPRKRSGLSKEQQLCELGKKVRKKFASDFYSLDNEEEKENNFNKVINNNEERNNFDHVYVTFEDTPAEYTIEVMTEGNEGSEVDMQNILPATPVASSHPIPSTSNENLEKSTPANNLSMQHSSPKNKTPRNVLVPTRRRIKPREPIRKNALSYLSEKFEKENINKKIELELQDRKIAIEEKRVQIEERKIALEEKRFELEYKERMEKLNLEKQRIEIDLNDRRITQQMLEAQQVLIKKLLKTDFEN